MQHRYATTIERSGDLRRVLTAAPVPGRPDKWIKLADVLDGAAPTQTRGCECLDSYSQIVERHHAIIDRALGLIEREGLAAYEAAVAAQEDGMQHVSANDYMTGSAKAAVDAALTDAKGQRVGSVPVPTPGSPEGARPTPEAAQPAPESPR